MKIINKEDRKELSLLSYLKISDKSPKLAHFDWKRGLIFLANTNTTQDGSLSLHLIQLSQRLLDGDKRACSDSEDENLLSPQPSLN